jgi:hypothetical protein
LRGNDAADNGRRAQTQQCPAKKRATTAAAMIIIAPIITDLRTVATPFIPLVGVRRKYRRDDEQAGKREGAQRTRD